MKRPSKGPKKARRRISDGAFPPTVPDPKGNYEQRRAWAAIQRKRHKELRRARWKELKKLPANVKGLIKGTKELNESIKRREEAGE